MPPFTKLEGESHHLW